MEEKYGKEAINKIYEFMQHINAKTIWNVFDSCNNYYMPNTIHLLAKCKIMYWYGENEKLNRKSDIAYVKKNRLFISIEGTKNYFTYNIGISYVIGKYNCMYFFLFYIRRKCLF